MGLIQCAENCKYQQDGYCNLETCSNINSLENDCPHYIPSSLDNSKRLSEGTNPDKLD